MLNIQDSGGKEGGNDYFAMPQHIRMSKGRARLPKFPEGIRLNGSEERPAEIGEARQLAVTKVAGECFRSICYELDRELP